jgi:hypothetical protein
VTFARVWRAPLWAHLGALGVVLLLLLPVIGTDPSFTPDEGAAVIQATSLSRGDGWIVEHPFPEVDPGQELYPVRLWQRGANGFAPLAKHPLYGLLGAGAHRVGGVPGMVLLSLIGTLAAAGLAALLARRIAPDIDRATLWTVGLASPLLFDGYLVMGHTLAASAAAGAALSAIVAIERRRPAWALAVAPCVAVATLLRNEALFLAAALAVTTGGIALYRRNDRRLAATAGLVAGISAVAGVVAAVGDRLWLEHIVGDGLPGPAAPFTHGAGNLVTDRLEGFVITWLRPTQLGSAPVVIALLVMLAAVLYGAVRARRAEGEGEGDGRNGTPVILAGAVAAVASVVALAAEPANVVPGLLVAFPLAAAGLVVLSRRTFAAPAAVVAGGTFLLFALAVVATQYRTGGTGEWGGRYFALGLPVLVPVLVLALRDRGRRLAPPARRAAAVSLAVCSLSMTTMAVVAHRSANDASSRLASWVEAGTARAAVPGDGRPVVVSTDEVLPRLAWAAFDDRRWLVAAPFQLEGLVGRLRDTGLERFALVTADPVGVRPLLGGAAVQHVDSGPDGQGLSILLVSPAGPVPAEVVR